MRGIVSRLREEFRVWHHVWQQLETLLDRTGSQRDTDGEHAAGARALLSVAAALEMDRRARTGRGLAPPFEQALRDDPGGAGQELAGWIAPVLGLPPVGTISDPSPSTDPAKAADRAPIALSARLPGAFDCEVAAGAGGFIPNPAISDDDRLRHVFLEPTPAAPLFRYFDGQSHAWVNLFVPAYEFPWSNPSALPWMEAASGADPGDGLFPPGYRALAGASPEVPIQTWRQLRDCRRARTPPLPHAVAGTTLDALDHASAEDVGPIRQDLVTTAQAAAAACRRGLTALGDADQASAIADAGMDVAGLTAGLGARAALYDQIAGAVSGGAAARTLVGRLGPLVSDAAEDQLGKALDQAVEPRVGYPDGSLRLLRLLELTLSFHWRARLPWFARRFELILGPIFERALAPFLTSLRNLVHREPTGAVVAGLLGQAAADGAPRVMLAAGGYPVAGFVSGQVVVLGGARQALAVLLQEQRPTRDGRRPFAIAPLRVSLVADGPGIPGLIEEGVPVTSGPPLGLAPASLRHGVALDWPEHDGVPRAVIALWSRLCLVWGTTRVEAALVKDGRSPPSLSDLPYGATLPVLGTVEAGANRLVLDVVAVKRVIDVDDPSKGPFARANELMLLRGTDENGEVRQAAVEVQEIARVAEDEVNEEAITAAPLDRPICRQGPGQRLVVILAGNPLDTALVSGIVLSRTFVGFAGPMLAVRAQLPDAVASADPHAPPSSNMDRGAELESACRLLDEWFPQSQEQR